MVGLLPSDASRLLRRDSRHRIPVQVSPGDNVHRVDFRDGKVTRQVNYWDGRRNPDDTASPNSQYPYGLGVETVDEKAAPEMIRTATECCASGK